MFLLTDNMGCSVEIREGDSGDQETHFRPKRRLKCTRFTRPLSKVREAARSSLQILFLLVQLPTSLSEPLIVGWDFSDIASDCLYVNLAPILLQVTPK